VNPEQLFERRGDGLLDKVLASVVDASEEGDGLHPAHGHEHGDAHGHGHEHEHGHEHDPHADAPAQSFVVRAGDSATRKGVERFFAGLPDHVWRAKGFLHVDGKPSLVQYSLGQLEITPARDEAGDAIVFIGNGMDRPAIEASFAQACRP
jgi:G3E family GTPase